MNTRLKKLNLTLLILIVSSSVMAETVQKLVISKNDQTEVSFLMSEEPVVKFNESNNSRMEISTTSSKIELNTFDLNKMTLVNIDNTKIDNLLNPSETSFTWQGDALLIDVAKDTSSIAVYGIDGKEILSKTLSAGRHALSLSSLPKGACVIKINGKTIKIWNR